MRGVIGSRRRQAGSGLLLAFCLLAWTAPGFGGETGNPEVSGFAGVELRLFTDDPLYPDQERDNGSLVLQPEYRYEWPEGSIFTAVPFLRLDSADPERSHADIRELNVLWLWDWGEVQAGIGKVFWGTTEFVHLVDIINQTDLIEHIDGEDKLGQPMVRLSVPSDYGTLEAFVLPWFRERTFPGRRGRLRSPLVVDPDETLYERGSKQRHVDLAVRYSHTLGSTDFGIYHFTGTGREPTLRPGLDDRRRLVLVPIYEQIDQTGLDVQSAVGGWLFKFEGFRRTGQGDPFAAASGGFEYTFFGIGGSYMDLGLVMEYVWDERQEKATSPYQDDLMFGVRVAPNDPQGSQALLGVIQDLDNGSSILTLESSRRIGEDWKVSLDGAFFMGQPRDDYLYGVREDDFLRLELFYYF